jgi:hypothetical protein
MIAHLGGVPIDEALPTVTVARAGLAVAPQLHDAAPATPSKARIRVR